MGAWVKRTQRDYTMSFKLAVVEQIERGEMTCKEALERYGIQSRSTFLVWLRKHGQLDWHKLHGSEMKRDLMESEKRPQTPEQRIKELEIQLKEANLKAQLFESMLDIIKTEYGVAIPKKPLGLRSKGKKLFE